jgi:hypothetical protein
LGLDIPVLLPDNYVGREVHVLLYTDDEVANAAILPKKIPSDFFGTLSLEDGEKLQKYIIQSRNKWERGI